MISVFVYAFYKLRREYCKKDAAFDEGDENEENKNEKEPVEKMGKSHWSRARIVMHMESWRLSAEHNARMEEIGLEHLKQAKDDAVKILRVLRNGVGSSKTKLKIPACHGNDPSMNPNMIA